MESGEFIPERVKCGAGHGERGAADAADEVRGVLLSGEELSLKGVVGRKLNHAYHSFCLAMWAQPMRWLAVCGRFLQHVCGKSRSKSFQLVALEVRLKLLDLEKFLFERVAFHRHGLMLLDEFEIRRLVFEKLLLDLKDGVVDVGALREAKSRFDRLKEKLEGCCRACRAGCYRGNVWHWFDPLWSSARPTL